MVTLKAVSNYANREQVYRAGERFQLEEQAAQWLLRDAPGVIVREEEVPAAPTDHKAAGRPRRKG